MEIIIPKSRAPHPALNKINSSASGTVTLLEETRLAEKQTHASLNLIQVQDGVWHTRWGRETYGNAITGHGVINGAFEYVHDRGKSTELRHLVVIMSDGVCLKSVNNGITWTVVTGFTFSTDCLYSHLQIDHNMYIVNGVDPLTLYNGTNLVTYAGIDEVTNLAITRTTLTTGSYYAYYQVTALNEVGETAGCTEVSIAINKERTSWTGTEALNLTWTAVSGAVRYQIYYADQSGYESLISSSATNSFVDNGSTVENPYIITPIDDTTIAPKFTHIELSGNRIWGAGDPDNPYRVHFSGVGQFINYFSAFYGGGWIDLEYGGREAVIGVVNYRNGKGDEIATVFSKTPEGTGSIWQIQLDVATAEDITFTLPVPSKIVDYIGCVSSRGIVKAGDKVFFPNINGIFDLGNKEQIFNILVSAEISQPIRPDYRDFDENNLKHLVGYYYDGKIFYSGSRAGGANDVSFIYDVERKNWNYYWDFGVKEYLECTDTTGHSHFLYVPTNGTQLCEMSELFKTDFAGSFRTLYTSGLFGIDDRIDSFGKIYQCLVEFGQLYGVVRFEVFGEEKWRGFRLLAQREYTVTSTSVDFVDTLFGDYAFGDSDDVAPPYTSSTTKKRLRINKRLNSLQYQISSNSVGTEYSLLGLQANGRAIAMMPPNKWRN